MRGRFPLAVFILAFAGTAIASEPPAKHVIIVVWDGMRPDFVTEQNTPTLWDLAQSGVTFRNNHSVYPSATIVNGTAINTGVYPSRSGILANNAYDPEHGRKSYPVENEAAVLRGDYESGQKYVGVPTIAELIHGSGGKTAIATAKTVGLLFDRHCDGRSCQDVFAGGSIPHDALFRIAKRFGGFPPTTQPGDRDTWTTKGLTEVLWHDGVPTFSVLWLSEPDDTEHKTAPGDPAALAAIRSSDENLARLVEALEQHKAKSTTDIFVVSDHGFSTIARSIDVPKILRDAGFDAVTEFTSEPKPGQIMVVGNGGTVLFYVVGHDTAITQRLVDFLQQTDFAGVIFTRQQMEGTFELEKAKVGGEHAPDVEMAFRWSDNKNQFGIPGMIDADWQRAAGKGTHATLSRCDMHNTLIAAGPDFEQGLTSDLASGNVDLAPTILSILGIKGPAMDGRVLSEAMKHGITQKSETQTIEASKKLPGGTWRQRLTISKVGATIYLDQGNGGLER